MMLTAALAVCGSACEGGDVAADDAPATDAGPRDPKDAARDRDDDDRDRYDEESEDATRVGDDADGPRSSDGGGRGACDANDCDDLQLSVTRGATPLYVEVEAPAVPGGAVEAEYDWGDGKGFEETPHHRYLQAGTFTVTQRVRDGAGNTEVHTATIQVEPFVPVRFSRTDRSPCVKISPDGYQAECNDWGPGGVRSDAAIMPRSGVFYFEGRRLTPQGAGGGLGLATAAASLVESVGSTPQSLGVLGWGFIQNAGGTCTGETGFDTRFPDTGFVIDYRGASPIVHIIGEGGDGTARVRTTCTMAVSAPLHIIYSGERAIVGYEIRINTGADTTNFPFHFGVEQLRAALTAHGDPGAAAALVPGFGATRAGPPDEPPTIDVTGPTTVAVGQRITLQATANDVEDGVLTDSVVWSDLATQHHLQPNGKGATFSFTPTEVGRHPIVATVADADGRTATKTVLVTVTGTLQQFNPVQLTRDGLTGEGVRTSPDNLSARFDANGKYGIRANQGNFGRFWYFEVHRNTPVRNMGMGLIIKGGSLNPYDFVDVPWSFSINVSHGFWVNLIGAGDWPDAPTDEDYGFAVDYRGEHPIVYIIIQGVLRGTLHLNDIWVPVYPMVYGNPGAPEGAMDMTINFGATPFRMDPRAVLRAAGVDASALKVGWGDVNAR